MSESSNPIFIFELLVALLMPTIRIQRVSCSIIECEENNSCNNGIYDGNRDDISLVKCFGKNSWKKLARKICTFELAII